jgi:hypothetical protein
MIYYKNLENVTMYPQYNNIIKKKKKEEQAPVAPACNPRYSGGRD